MRKITALFPVLFFLFLSCGILPKKYYSSCGCLENDISLNWKRIDSNTFWNPDVTFVRSDKFISKLTNEYKECLINLTKEKIIQLFGETLMSSKSRVIYVCVPPDSMDELDKVCINFFINADGTVTDIKVNDCGRKID